MRLCPSVEGSASPLITHRIGVDVCLARQSSNFHKCHRCIYRGKPAAWEPEHPPLAMINVYDAEEPTQAAVKIETPRQEIVAKSTKKGRGGNSAAASAAV